jgi:metacaspase-1
MEGSNKTTQQKRLATLVGCNYAGMRYELRGCINDALAMRDLLVSRFGFAPADVAVLTDDAGVVPTGANIKRARGARGRALLPLQRPRRDEAIVPCDFNLITGNKLAHHHVRARVVLSLTLMPGHLGTCCRRGFPGGGGPRAARSELHGGVGLVPRRRPHRQGEGADRPVLRQQPRRRRQRHHTCFLSSRLQSRRARAADHLSGSSGVDASHHASDHLLALFGADASSKFLRHDSPPARPDEGILLSGCQTDETSADVEGSSGNGKAHPAPMSNREVVSRARAALTEQGFQQHPCLYCSDDNADAPFLDRNAKGAMPEL